MKNLIGFICLILMILFYSCSKQDSIKIGDNFDLNFEQTLAFEKGGFELEFIKVIDSRCPTNSLCHWPGSAIIDLQIIHPENENAIIRLETALNAPISIPNTAVYNDYIIELIDLLPYPERDTIAHSQYTAVLNITQQ